MMVSVPLGFSQTIAGVKSLFLSSSRGRACTFITVLITTTRKHTNHFTHLEDLSVWGCWDWARQPLLPWKQCVIGTSHKEEMYHGKGSCTECVCVTWQDQRERENPQNPSGRRAKLSEMSDVGKRIWRWNYRACWPVNTVTPGLSHQINFQSSVKSRVLRALDVELTFWLVMIDR